MNRLIDFSSRFRILKGGKISLVVSAFLGGAVIASAAPSGGTVTSGTANISQSGNVTNIEQSSNKASINWNNFSIKANETVNFNQPNSSSITLNRVIGNEKSVIDGALNANGQVWILNSNGVLFNSTAKVNTAGILATTAELSDTDFQNGNYNFKNSSKNSVINLGTIEVANSGYVVLASNEVKNAGTIKAVKGKVHLVGADEYTLNLNGNSIVNLIVNKGVLDSMVENSGTIIADGGEVYLTTNAVNELLKGVVNNTGIIEANSLDGLMGKVEVFAHGGTANVSGTIEAKDGFVETSGKELSVADGTIVKAKEWLIDPTDITIESSGSTTDLAGSSIKASFIESTLNGGTNVTLEADNDINVNQAVSWNTNTLTLSAGNDININATMTATNAAGLELEYGQSAAATGNTATYNINAPINIATTGSFSTKLGHNGEPTSWIVVNDAASLQSLTLSDNTVNYVLGSDIDLSSITNWTPIGYYHAWNDEAKFEGNFDGLGHTLSNLTINRPTESYVGLFGSLRYTQKIQNVGLLNVDVIGNNYVGGLFGTNSGGPDAADSINISKVYVTGSVQGNYSVGGLVGLANYNTIIDQSYTNVAVTGVRQIGGIAGSAQLTTISNTYSLGDVHANTDTVGGLVGKISGNTTVSTSYSTGAVTAGVDVTEIGGLIGKNDDGTNANVTNSYWDATTSGQATSAGGTAINTSDNFVASNYAGFDSNIWYLSNGLRPMLKMEHTTNITNAHQLQLMSMDTMGLSYTLANNIDLSAPLDNTKDVWNTVVGFTPIGNDSAKFTGDFDGLGHTISNLFINNPSLTENNGAGLFGNTNGASLQNIAVSGEVTGGRIAGGLVGNMLNGTIYNSVASVKVSGSADVGGLVGFAGSSSSINSSSASGDVLVPTASNVGGLVGNLLLSSITDSHASGDVSGLNNTGGLVGNLVYGSVSSSYATGDVTGVTGGESTGGLIGYIYNSGEVIEKSYAIGAVSGVTYVGGLIGQAGYRTVIRNNYSTGAVEGNTYVGGLVGLSRDILSDSYATGAVSGTTYVGGLVGYNTGTVSNSYWDKDTSGIATSTYGIGKSTAEFQNEELFSSNSVWSFGGGSAVEGYEAAIHPYLIDVTRDQDKEISILFESGWGGLTSEQQADADGSAYGIANWTQLANMTSVSDYKFTLLNDLGTTTSGYTTKVKDVDTLANDGTGWAPIYLDGDFDGQNYTIDGLIIDNPNTNYLGLFSQTSQGSEITNLNLTNVDITGAEKVGGLVGYVNSYTDINNVTVSGKVSGKSYVGGLVGSNGRGNITNAHSSVNVTQITNTSFNQYIGGLVGYNYGEDNDGEISNSSATGEVIGHGATSVGGLVGHNSNDDEGATISNSYATGAVKADNANKIGGLVGYNDNADIDMSYATGVVTANDSVNVGGLVGEAYNGAIENSHATGAVNADNAEKVGGLVGYANYGTYIDMSYATGVVTANDSVNVGGLIGSAEHRIAVYNSYATGEVTGNDSVGGLVGLVNDSTIRNTFSNGFVTGGTNVGGLVGNRLETSITNSFWDTQTSEQTVGIGGAEALQTGVTALTTAQMSYGQIFNNATWDIVADSSVTSSTPIIKYDSVNDKYVWAIAPLSLSYTLGAQSSTYNGQNQLLSELYATPFGSPYSFLDGDYHFSVDNSSVASYKNAGTYEDIQVASDNDFLTIKSSGNTDGSFTINKANATVTANSDTKTYNGLTQSVNDFSVVGLVGEDGKSVLDGISVNGNGTNAGIYTTSASGTDENYNLTFVDGKLTIQKANATVTADSRTTTYNGDSQSVNDFSVVGLVGEDGKSVLDGISVNGNGTNAGIYTTSASGTDENYNLTFVDGKLTISKRAITINPDKKSKVYGSAEAALSTTVSNTNGLGLASTDTLNDVIGTLSRQTGENVGSYDVLLGDGLKSSNYEITYNSDNNAYGIRPDMSKLSLVKPPVVPVVRINNNANIVSEPLSEGRATRLVSLSEIRTNQENGQVNNGIPNQQEVRVPLARNSVVDLVNGGVNLPIGVDQLFFASNDEN